MRYAQLALIIGPCLLAAPLPGLAQTSAANSATALPAPDDDSLTLRARAHDEIGEWRAKINAWAVEQKANGKEASADARADLDSAWKKTQDAEDRLDKATAAGWAEAKSAYLASVASLAAAWHRTAPGRS